MLPRHILSVLFVVLALDILIIAQAQPAGNLALTVPGGSSLTV